MIRYVLYVYKLRMDLYCIFIDLNYIVEEPKTTESAIYVKFSQKWILLEMNCHVCALHTFGHSKTFGHSQL